MTEDYRCWSPRRKEESAHYCMLELTDISEPTAAFSSFLRMQSNQVIMQLRIEEDPSIEMARSSSFEDPGETIA